MRSYIIFLFCVFYFLLFNHVIELGAQTIDTSVTKESEVIQSKFGIGAFVTPSFTMLQVKPKGFYKGQFAYSGGINFLYSVGKKIFLKTGVNYKLKRALLEDVPNTADLIQPDGSINYDKITYYDIKFNFNYISLPITFNYILLKLKKNSIFLSTGFEINYLYKATDKFKNYIVSGEKTKSEFIYTGKDISNELTTSISFGVGLYRPVFSKFIMVFKPEYIYDLSGSSNNLSILSAKFHTYGLSVEIYYHRNE